MKRMQMLKAFVMANRMKSKLSLFSECVETKLCKPCASFLSQLHSSCGLVWYRTLRVKAVHIFPLTATQLVWTGVV